MQRRHTFGALVGGSGGAYFENCVCGASQRVNLLSTERQHDVEILLLHTQHNTSYARVNALWFPMASLQQDQFAAGMPIETGDTVVASSAFLRQPQQRTQADDAYEAQAVLKWSNCSSERATHESSAVDLESVARDILNTCTAPLFADISQGDTNICTSMALTHAFSLRYVLRTRTSAFQEPHATVPQLSALYAYYFQRIEECKLLGACACVTCKSNPSCFDACDPPCLDCGSYLRSAASVFMRGVCTTALWPSTSGLNDAPSAAARANAAAFRITQLRCVVPNAASVAAEVRLGHPVAVFLNLTPEQVRWMQAQSLSTNTAVEEVLLPQFTTSDTTVTVGHVVLVDGVNARVLLARNNYGNSWGANGRFAIALSNFTPQQVHSAVAVYDVCAPPPSQILFNAIEATACTDAPSAWPSG